MVDGMYLIILSTESFIPFISILQISMDSFSKILSHGLSTYYFIYLATCVWVVHVPRITPGKYYGDTLQLWHVWQPYSLVFLLKNTKYFVLRCLITPYHRVFQKQTFSYPFSKYLIPRYLPGYRKNVETALSTQRALRVTFNPFQLQIAEAYKHYGPSWHAPASGPERADLFCDRFQLKLVHLVNQLSVSKKPGYKAWC